MANILGRNDRRRRVLNEEALSASTAHLALRRGDVELAAAKTQRYSEQAGVEHHPQITDFLPRRFSTLSMLAGVGIATTAVVEALYWYADPLTTDATGMAFGPLAMRVVGGIEAWISAMLLLTAAMTCLMIYSLRRHRIDDFRGRYRVWLAGTAACLVASVDSVAPVHSLFASAAAHYSGWTAMRAHSVWWISVAGLPLAWITVRAWLDARESRLAATALAAAAVSYGIAFATFLAGWPAGDVRTERVVSSAATLVGNWMLLLGVVSYGRYVVLDAQGLIAARATRPQSTRKPKQMDVTSAESCSQPVTARAERVAYKPTPTTNTLRAFREELRESGSREDSHSAATKWVDGSRPVDERYDDEEDTDEHSHKLSKADRKRMRKLKAQNRAA